jgi:uncharacterized protein YbbK (DUF523 family)
MQYVLVSSCLLGNAVRYDGKDKLSRSNVLKQWLQEGRVIAVCPEVEGGMSIPRPAAEVSDGKGGRAVLAGIAVVRQDDRQDVTYNFITGASKALAKAKAVGIQVAVLKEGSPSCGSNFTYDGNFTNKTVNHPGVTTAMLQEAGVKVFNEESFALAEAEVRRLEARSAA